MKLLKERKILVKFYFNEIEVIRLDNGQSIKQNAPFSTNRLIIADFTKATELLTRLVKEIKGPSFLTNLVVIIQQKHDFPDGLSQLERNAYTNIAEHVGAVKMFLLKDSKDLSDRELNIAIKDFESQL